AGSRLAGPLQDPRGSPFGVLPMGRGPVGRSRDVLTLSGKSPMGSHPDVVVEDLNRGIREASLHLRVDEGVGNAVVVLLDLDVIVDVDRAPLPMPDLVALRGEGPKQRTVELFEKLAPAHPELLEGTSAE